MGIDIAIVRADAGSAVASAMRDSLRRRGMDESLLAVASEADRDWRAAQRAVEEARANAIRQNREVGRLKRSGDEEAIRAQIQVAHEAGQNEAALRPRACRAKAVAAAAMRALPNLLHPRVPDGMNDADNRVERTWWPERPGAAAACSSSAKGRVDVPLTHDVLLYRIGGYQPKAGSRVGGRRAYYLTGPGAELNSALLAFATRFLRRRQIGKETGGRPFVQVSPPLMMAPEAMAKVAQLQEFDEALYRVGSDTGASSVANSDLPGTKADAIDTNCTEATTTAAVAPVAPSLSAQHQYLIATSEQPLCCLHQGECLVASELPMRYAGVSPCFRREAGSRRDARGVFRVHTFEKVEQFAIAMPDTVADAGADAIADASADETRAEVRSRTSSQDDAIRLLRCEHSCTILDEMLATAEAFYQLLELPYRVVCVAACQLSHAAAIKYDLEGWFPADKGGGCGGSGDEKDTIAVEDRSGCHKSASPTGAMRELVSASNCTDFQSRALDVRCEVDGDEADTTGNASDETGKKQNTKKKKKKKKKSDKPYVHMLNATLCATTRTMCCILENYQTDNGVRVPRALVADMDGVEFLPFVRPAPE